MTFDEAKKLVQGKSIKSNWMVIKQSYDTKIVVPYKDGMAILNALENAELLTEPYIGQEGIFPFDRGSIDIEILAHSDYEEFKIAMLLGVKRSELHKYKENSNESSSDT